MSNFKGELKKEQLEKQVTHREIITPIIIFIVVTGIIVFSTEERKYLMIKLLKNKLFMFTFLAIVLFSTYQMRQESKDDETIRRKRATREGILGMVVAVLAYLDLKAAPFFIIWIVSYYMDN